jgi:tRNA nucleotidyltransferase (CCA-adding enzyme)
MKQDINISIPRKVKYIMDKLCKSNYQAFIVGGCVRDSILGKVPGDWDIATNALPGKVKELFPKTVDTGIRHGTVTVLIGKSSFEVTTYRIDGIYENFRKPESVTFTSSIEEDLSRRDFTMNAIAYSPEAGIVDPFGGITDIRNGVIRAVGDPGKRFSEDTLRMLRAVRFSSQLGFSVDEKTLKFIEANSSLIGNISSERIRDELTKILLSDNPHCFSLLMETKLIKYTLPEFEPCFLTSQNNPYHIYNVAEHTLAYMASVIGMVVRLAYMYFSGNLVYLNLNPTFKDVLLNNLDPFIIWQSILMVFGISIVSGISEKKSIIAVAGMWLATLAISFGSVMLAN